MMAGILRRAFTRNNLNREQAPWAREVQERIQELEVAEQRRADAEGNLNKTQNSSMNRLAETVQVLPIPAMASSVANGFSLTAGGTQEKANTTLVVPEGKNFVSAMIVGSAAAVDLTTGGLTNCYMSLAIDATISTEFSSAKDAGASAVNNIMTGSLGATKAVTPGSTIVFRLYLRPLNAAAFSANAGNYASLSVLALFTTQSD